MPKEVYDKNEFIKIATRASEIRIKKNDDVVKVKARTKTYLYTIKVKPEEVDDLINKIKQVRADIKIVNIP